MRPDQKRLRLDPTRRRSLRRRRKPPLVLHRRRRRPRFLRRDPKFRPSHRRRGEVQGGAPIRFRPPRRSHHPGDTAGEDGGAGTERQIRHGHRQLQRPGPGRGRQREVHVEVEPRIPARGVVRGALFLCLHHGDLPDTVRVLRMFHALPPGFDHPNSEVDFVDRAHGVAGNVLQGRRLLHLERGWIQGVVYDVHSCRSRRHETRHLPLSRRHGQPRLGSRPRHPRRSNEKDRLPRRTLRRHLRRPGGHRPLRHRQVQDPQRQRRGRALRRGDGAVVRGRGDRRHVLHVGPRRPERHDAVPRKHGTGDQAEAVPPPALHPSPVHIVRGRLGGFRDCQQLHGHRDARAGAGVVHQRRLGDELPLGPHGRRVALETEPQREGIRVCDGTAVDGNGCGVRNQC
mmetsp:Transcript_37846/g.77196  ORF Transcript_37846/g.77196 Transcript_37846/m.77196 type:complete len:399 (-) Transcript_37846:203-1399(-)